jgi:hypothetical protein
MNGPGDKEIRRKQLCVDGPRHFETRLLRKQRLEIDFDGTKVLITVIATSPGSTMLRVIAPPEVRLTPEKILAYGSPR